MRENYLTGIERRLRDLFAQVNDGTETVDNAVAFLKDELLASYKRGRTSVAEGRAKARPNGQSPFRRSSAIKR